MLLRPLYRESATVPTSMLSIILHMVPPGDVFLRESSAISPSLHVRGNGTIVVVSRERHHALRHVIAHVPNHWVHIVPLHVVLRIRLQ